MLIDGNHYYYFFLLKSRNPSYLIAVVVGAAAAVDGISIEVHVGLAARVAVLLVSQAGLHWRFLKEKEHLKKNQTIFKT
jgi:hypothetical protein